MTTANTPGPSSPPATETTRNTPSPVEQPSPTPATTTTPTPDKQTNVPRDQPGRTVDHNTKRRLSAVDFSPEEPVTYLPEHARGDPSSAHAEHGVVTSTNASAGLVFVRFNGETQHKACYPHTLVKRVPKLADPVA